MVNHLSTSSSVLPYAGSGQRVGLLGGSFDPPHFGHIEASRFALKRLKLDWVWWIVTPGNPLKSHAPSPIGDRMSACKELIEQNHVRIKATDFESSLPDSYTVNSLSYLRSHRPDLNFAWIIGADNIHDFHHWKRWKDIVDQMPLVIISRPGAKKVQASQVTTNLAAYRIDEAQAASQLFSAPTPSWVLLNGLKCDVSSTDKRAASAA